MQHYKDIIQDPWVAAILIFTTQLLMLYLRTINIIHTTERNILGALWSNNGIALTWLVSMSIGLNSMLTGQWQPIIAFLMGGSLGTYWSIYNEIKKDKKKFGN